jgi:hypothetical protein
MTGILFSVLAGIVALVIVEGLIAAYFVRRQRRRDNQVEMLLGELKFLTKPGYEPEDGCPAIGVGGVHSDTYLEDRDSCAWCGQKPEQSRNSA